MAPTSSNVLPAPASQASTVWLSRFAWFCAFCTLLLICSGGMVTSKGVGLAVPDWPTTFGYNMFLFPVSKWIGGIFFEHTHRLIASTVGLLTIVLAVWIWRADRRRWMRSLGLIAIGAVVLQGILGGLRVTLLKDQIGIFHACLAQAFLGLIVFIAVATTEAWKRMGQIEVPRSTVQPDRWIRLVTRIALATTVAIYLQLALGATMRHQHRDLSILDFPTAYGSWIPDTSAATLAKINQWREARALSEVDAFQIWLQMVHRMVAVLIAVGVTVTCSRALKLLRSNPAAAASGILRRLSIVWLIGIFLQVTLGAWTIWSNKAADIATAHVAVGAVMLSLGVAIVAFCLRSQTRMPDTLPVEMRSAVVA